MNGGWVAITAKKDELFCIGLVLANTLGFYVKQGKENLSYNLDYFSEQKLIDFVSLKKLFLVNT